MCRAYQTTMIDDSTLDPRRSRWILGAGIALLAAIALLIGADLAGDWSSGAGFAHLAIEGLVVLASLAGASFAARALYVEIAASRSRAGALQQELTHAREDAERWRAESRALVRGLAAAIDEQLARWSLTPAEREVAMLLLKGLSLKDIAEVRGTSERTARQQSLAIYKKAGLSGRAELSAFFLEDLLAGKEE